MLLALSNEELLGEECMAELRGQEIEEQMARLERDLEDMSDDDLLGEDWLLNCVKRKSTAAWESPMTSKGEAWVAAKLAKAVDMSKPLGEMLDILALHARSELSRWCANQVTLRNLRQRIHEEIKTGNMGTAESVAAATAVVLSRIVNKE